VGLALYPEADLERFDVQVRFGQQLLELAVLGLDLTKHPRVAGLRAAKARPPLVEGRVAESALAAQLLDRQTGLGLLEKSDDLFVSESALPHVRSFLGKRTLLTFDWHALWGQVNPPVRVPSVPRTSKTHTGHGRLSTQYSPEWWQSR